MKELLTAGIPAIITSMITFVLTRRKYNMEVRKAGAEADSTEIENLDRATKIWRELSEEVTKRLTSDIDQLREENRHTREKLNALTRENNALRAQMASLQKELVASKVENAKLMEQLRVFNQHFKEQP